MSEQSAPPPVETPSPWRRLVPGVGLSHAGLLLGTALACALILAPGLSHQRIPELTSADVGRPFRSGTPYGFKAARDYRLADPARTGELQADARARVLPVFDFNPQVLDEVKGAVAEGFSRMRQEVGEWSSEQPRRPEESARKRRPEEQAAETQQLRARLAAARREFEAHLAPLEGEEFDALAADGFSAGAEQEVLHLLDRAYPVAADGAAGAVVGSREELTQAGISALMVRPVDSSAERHAAAQSVLDVREARAVLDRFAAEPGNVLPDAPLPLRRAVAGVARRQVRPNLAVNLAETRARREASAASVPPQVTLVRRGEKVLGDGELITEAHLARLAGMRAQVDRLDGVQLQLGGALMAALVLCAAWLFFKAAFPRFRPTRRDGLLLALLLVGSLGLLQAWTSVTEALHDRYPLLTASALNYAVPVSAGALLVRFLLGHELALFFAVVLAPLASVAQGNSVVFGLYALAGSLVGADRIGRARDFGGIFRAGAWVGLVNALTLAAFSLIDGTGADPDSWRRAAAALVGSAVTVPAVVVVLTPLLEALFGYASDIRLLQLANLNHPALKELIVQAPGTYHHSIVMGSLVETAAEAIGANPLLARSCAYYHDIGKSRNPLYFGENQRGEDRHESLAPAMSALIIKRHVTEGLEMARQYSLPRRVADAISQHHGTRLVGYFFHKAQREQEGREYPQPVDPAAFRYPGPKPQFREAALVMLADSVEAASRSLQEPSPEKLEVLVQKLVHGILADGQLDDCDLTLKDLAAVSRAFVTALEGIYRARPGFSAAGPRAGEGSGPLLAAVRDDERRSAGS
ncbi:MAG: HDIG domain-containing protein [Deltaproteobacteria bacterium]|nr:HDIG domain-containing protein [Deltaproteobacteria bacterium]